MKTFTIDTYPDTMIDYENGIENPDYDHTVAVFTVPYDWAESYINRKFKMNMECLLREYTWDWTLQMYNDAYIAGRILDETIDSRDNL